MELKLQFDETLESSHLKKLNRYNNQIKNEKLIHRKNIYLKRYLERHFENEMIEAVTFEFDSYDPSSIRIVNWQTLSPEQTVLVVQSFNNLVDLNKNWVMEKRFDSSDGTFKYELNRRIGKKSDGGTYYYIKFLSAGNIDGCKITKRRKMKYVYETDCSDV